MKWRRNTTTPFINQQPDNGVIKKSFSLSNLLPPWLSKLKPKHPKSKPINSHPLISAPTPTPSPSSSPPPAHAPTPRRLSTGDADPSRPLPPRTRRHSIGSELDLQLPFQNPTRSPRPRRKKPPALKPVVAVPVKTGRRSFGGGSRIRPRFRIHSPRLSNPKVNEKGLESFAVVKRSRDPVRDFRESMVEMIWVKGIGRPEELERLLTCYLSLNAEEHHEMIVKVFRQVWFDLSREMDPVP